MSMSSELIAQTVPQLEKTHQNDIKSKNKSTTDALLLKKDIDSKKEDENGVVDDHSKK